MTGAVKLQNNKLQKGWNIINYDSIHALYSTFFWSRMITFRKTEICHYLLIIISFSKSGSLRIISESFRLTEAVKLQNELKSFTKVFFTTLKFKAALVHQVLPCQIHKNKCLSQTISKKWQITDWIKCFF